MVAEDSDRASLVTHLGREAAGALLDWAGLNNLSVTLHFPPWAPSGKGYTGALLQALQIAPPARVVVLKILPAGALRGEPRAHAQAYRASPPGFVRDHLAGQAFPPYPVSDGRVLMFQEAADDGLWHTEPLRVLRGEEFTSTCGEVVRGLLTEWNLPEREREPQRMRASEFLRAELGDAWSSGGSVRASGGRLEFLDNIEPWIYSDGDWFPNPYLMVTGHHPELPDPEVSILTGLAHRDLHLENILIPRRRGILHSDAYRLIDLCTFSDQAALTRDVVTMLLSGLVPYVCEPLPAAQQHALLQYVVNPHQEHLARIPPEVAQRIDCIRDTAENVMRRWRDPWTDQFLLSVHAAALVFTSYTDLGDVGRKCFLRLAAYAGGWLLKSREESARSGEPSRSNSFRVSEFLVPDIDARPADERPARQDPLRGQRQARAGVTNNEATIGLDSDGTVAAIGVSQPGVQPSLDQRRRLVLALEAIPAMADPAMRGAVVGLLPAEIASSLPRSQITRIDLLGIVEICLAFPNGLTRLWEAVCLVDTGTEARDALDGVLAEMPGYRRPMNGDPE